MSGKDKRSPPDTGRGSQLEESTKGATSSGRRVLPSVVATLSGRRVLPNVGRSSDVKETDRKFDEGACSNDHQTSSSRADSTDSNLKGKKKESFVSNIARQFSSEQTTETQHQLKPKTQSCEKGEKKKELPKQGKNKTKECRPNLEEQSLKENLKIHVNKNVEGLSTSASAGESMKGENLSKSFVVLTSDGEDEIELNVEMGNQDCFSVSVGLNDTVEAVMLKIEEKKGFSCENQRLVMDGNQLYETDTLLSHGIDKDATIHLVVKTENDADKAKGDSSSGLESNPTEVPDTSNNPESMNKRDAMENNRTEETDPSCSSQQDSTENGNSASQIEKSEPRIPNSPSPTPTSDVGSKYLHEQQGGMLTHPTDSQMKEKVEKSQQFMKSYKESTTKVEKLTTKVSDDGSDMNQEKGDTEIEIEGEMKIPQTPETEVEKKTPQTPETEGEKKTHQTPETEGEKDTKDDLNVLKMDKDPDGDDESEDDQQSQQKFVNDLSKGDDDPSTENLKVQSLQRDDEVLDDSGSHLSESNSVEIISEEDHEEEIRGGENFSIPSFSMTSMTQIPDDNNTELKLQTELCSTHGTGDEIVHGVNNAAKMPETHNAEGEDEIKHFVDGDGSVTSEEHETKQQASETFVYHIDKVGDVYLLNRQNSRPVILPQLEGASNVSVSKNMILIDKVPRYFITMENGKVTISELEVAKLEVNRGESSNTKRSEQDLSAGIQEHKGAEEGLGMKKVRKTTPDMQKVLNPPQENETNLSKNHQDTMADDKHTGSSGAAVIEDEAKADVNEIIFKLQNMELEDAPGEQQPSLEEAVYKDEKRPKPAPRSKNNENKLENDNDPKSPPTPPPRARRNSQNQPPEKKIQDSDVGTAGSLPPTDIQQSACQHGASGKDDSKTFPVIYRYSGNGQEKRKLTPLNEYIKYRYVTKNKARFKKVADDLQNEKQIAISFVDQVLHIDQRHERNACFETVLEFILRGTRNIEVIGRPISGVDYKIVEKELSSSESYLSKEISSLIFENKIYVACDISLSTEVDNYVSMTLKKFSYANKGNISEKSEVPYILRKILEKDDWKVQFKDKYPNVQVKWGPDDDEDVVKVVFTGNKEKVLEAMKWFEENIVGEYCCCNKEMVKIPELSLFSQPEEVVLEYLHVKYENQTDIEYAINEKKNRVWFCSKTSQGNADIAKKEITNKGEIVKTVEIPVAEPLLHDTGINELIPDWNKSKYAVVQVDEDKIVVKGLEKYVCEFEGKIKEMLERKQSMPKSENSLEYDSFLLFIEKNGILECLSERYEIQYSPFENAKRNGIYFTGEGTCLAKFNEELEKKRKEYITHNINIHLEKGMEITKLDEILHTAEKDHGGHLKIEKVKNKDTPPPGNYKTTTVLGATLKDDLQDCLYTQWCLDTCTVTLVENKSYLPSADVVLVPVDENSKSGLLQGNKKKIAVPIPQSDISRKNSTATIESFLCKFLSDEACISVYIGSSPINGRPGYKYVKQILYSLMERMKKSNSSRKDIVLCCCNKDVYHGCFERCIELLSSECMYETVRPINKDFVVEVKTGGIVDFEADVIVNSTGIDLVLASGAVSKKILESAGKELQDEVKRKKPNGIVYGEILETSAYSLTKMTKTKIILHGALDFYKSKSDLQKLEEFVSSCFEHADTKKFTSIALPAIGTGQLGFKKNEVAATMFKAAKKFFRDHYPSALRRVMFVIYGQDTECLKAFKAEEILWKKYLVSQSRAVVYEGVRVQPNQGSILDTTTDAVIYFWDDGKVHVSRTTRNNALLAACGRNVFDNVLKKMIERKGNMIKVKPEYIKADMFVIRCQNSADNIYNATKECLQEADKCKDTTSISIAFDRTHSFLLNKELTHFLCEAIKDISHGLHQIKQVEIIVEDEKSFQKVLEYFNMEKAGLLKMKEPMRIEVSGFKEHVTKVVAEIREKFSQLQTGNDIREAEPENDKKDTEMKGTNSGKIFIEPSSIFAKYVEVHNISEGLSKKQLKLDLFREGEFPIRLPKLVYYVGSSKALLICHCEQDAKELSECTSLVPFKFSSVKGKALSSVTKTIDQNTVEKMKEDGMYNQFKQDLQHADIQIKGESPFVLVAPTTFQYSYVKFILEELTGETVTSEHDDFHNIEAIKDVQENVWDILCCSDQFREIKDTCKDISYDKDTYTVMIGIELSKDDFQKITAIVDDLRDKEWDEIPLEKEHCNKSKAERWCDEVKEVTGYECCKYIDGKGKVLVYAVNYDDILKIKHLIGVKTGKIKTTGKARRGGKATSDNDRRQVDTAGSFGAESKSPDRRINGKNFQKYITKENIHVFVYEANILQLDVDCIVNAANESLQHGGGVAAVIEKAAGYQLTKESNDFVRKNRNLPVGTACTTTAGNLSYNCVIHTVGPRWSAYSPHSLQDVQDCQRHLYQAVYNSFLEAEKRSLKSIALPAISSAIFGVPEEICVQQYALATFDYSKRTSDEPTALKEIHFIDKNSNIVKKIQDAFYLVFVEGEMPHCDSSKFVKSRRHRRGHSPGSYTGAQASFSSSVHKDSFNASTQSATSDVFEVTQIEPLSFFDEKSNAYAYLLHGKEEYKLLLSRGDMLQVKASGVVIPVDNRGKRGNIGEKLFAMIPKEYEKAYTSKVSANFPHKKFCDTFVTAGYNCGYGFILHAVFSKSNQRKQDVHMLYNNILSSCDKENGIHSIVTTLLGSDTRSESDIKACADMFLQSYLEYYSRPVTKKSLLVHLVCREDLVYDCVKSVFDEYVMSKKPELNKTQEDKDTSASVQQVEKPDNDHEEENCVICMDTITDPETLKCGHTFCKDCIQAQFSFKQACPTCGLVCGVITGDQPEGDMRCTVERYTDCCGYEGYGRIVITYSFFGGRQGPEHPSPGTIYKGITRVAYLPNNDEGRKILAMLKIAFERKLVFTIGSSRTTGQEGVITWNDIHHKTNPRSHQQFGYPDPGYLERVKDELVVKGVTEKDIPKQ